MVLSRTAVGFYLLRRESWVTMLSDCVSRNKTVYTYEVRVCLCRQRRLCESAVALILWLPFQWGASTQSNIKYSVVGSSEYNGHLNALFSILVGVGDFFLDKIIGNFVILYLYRYVSQLAPSVLSLLELSTVKHTRDGMLTTGNHGDIIDGNTRR